MLPMAGMVRAAVIALLLLTLGASALTYRDIPGGSVGRTRDFCLFPTRRDREPVGRRRRRCPRAAMASASATGSRPWTASRPEGRPRSTPSSRGARPASRSGTRCGGRAASASTVDVPAAVFSQDMIAALRRAAPRRRLPRARGRSARRPRPAGPRGRARPLPLLLERGGHLLPARSGPDGDAPASCRGAMRRLRSSRRASSTWPSRSRSRAGPSATRARGPLLVGFYAVLFAQSACYGLALGRSPRVDRALRHADLPDGGSRRRALRRERVDTARRAPSERLRQQARVALIGPASALVVVTGLSIAAWVTPTVRAPDARGDALRGGLRGLAHLRDAAPQPLRVRRRAAPRARDGGRC